MSTGFTKAAAVRPDQACLVVPDPRLWPYRVAILAAVIILASVGSHMPARFRYYSILHGRMLEGHKPPPGSAT